MKKKGFTLIELLVVIAIIAMLLAILMPALNKVKKIAQRVVCGTNLKGLGTAQVVYANDYEDAFVIQGGVSTAPWDVTFGGGFANVNLNWANVSSITVGSSLYLLVREADVSPKSFICPAGAEDAYDGENANQLDITELWAFGRWTNTTPQVPDVGIGDNHGSKNHVSYSYQMPYGDPGGAGRYAADGTKSAAFAFMADKSPWYDPKLAKNPTPGDWIDHVRLMGFYFTNPSIEKWKIQVANSQPHSREGQNVLFGDGHNSYEKVTDVGIRHDGIYTIRLRGGNEGEIRRGDQTRIPYDVLNQYQPEGSEDSFLVNDDFPG